MTGTNEVYLPGVFGDVFDVGAYPDVNGHDRHLPGGDRQRRNRTDRPKAAPGEVRRRRRHAAGRGRT